MDPHGNQGFLQDTMSLDDLIDNGGWPAAEPQQHYPYAHTPQDPYAQYSATQPSFNQFALSQQPSYSGPAYSNSPYAAEYRQPAQNHVFDPASYDVDPSLHAASTFHAPASTFSFAPQAIENNTIAPQSLQYGIGSIQSNRNVLNPAFQQYSNANGAGNSPAPRPQESNATYYSSGQNGAMQFAGNPTQYSNMQNKPVQEQPKPTQQRWVEEKSVPNPRPSQQTKLPTPPQNPLRITHPDLYAAKGTSSRPSFEYAPFLSWEDKPIQITLGLKSTLPKYHPRKSQSGKELVPGLDLSTSLKPAQIASDKKRSRPPKQLKLSSGYKGTSQAARTGSSRVGNLRDGESLAANKSPSTPTETSSEEDESSSEEESEYEEDEMILKDVSEIRGETRPTNASQAARWDAIGIVWRDPDSSPSADHVKDAIEKFGDSVSSLRSQLKANQAKTEEAAARPAEVNRLRTERQELLESLYQTIDAANQHGYSAIVENLGGHHKLVNGLTTTLIECIKAADYLGKLPKAVFSLLAKFQTMTDELLKKLKFDSIQKRWNRKGDDETKKLIETIVANTKDAKERAARSQKDSAKAAEEKKVKEKFEQAKARNAEALNSTNPNSKRPHEGDGTNGKPNKKFASDVSGAPASSSKSTVPKRPTGNLLGIATKPAARPVVKKREVSPPTESKLGALLASIAKPPEPPKAPDAPTRAPETAEEKARRERKESRRHLRVRFKDGPDLEEIRLFKHEQAEDEGRQDEMLRDAHEQRAEGLMHKKRVYESIQDDEDEYQPPDVERPYQEPLKINFNSSVKSTPFGPKFTTTGGDVDFKTAEQKTQERREAVELMVVYSDRRDIPPSPKELVQTDGAAEMPVPYLKEPNEPWLIDRVLKIHQYGPETAVRTFQAHSEAQKSNTYQITPSSQAQNASNPNLSSVISQLSRPKPEASSMGAKETGSLLFLTSIVDSLKGKPAPISSPPDWMTNPARRLEWQAGYDRDNAAKLKREAEEKMAQMEAARFQPPPMVAPQYQQQFSLPQPPSYPLPAPPINIAPAPPDVTQQVQSFLTGYQNGDNNLSTPPQFDFNSWSAQQNPGSLAETHDYAQHEQQRVWEESNAWSNENSNPKSGRNQKKRSGGHEPKPVDNSPFDENGEYKGKKKPCRFYRDGKCAKGAKCTYLHDD